MSLDDVEQLGEDLVEELAANDRAAALVDPRTVQTRFSLLKKMSLSPAHYYEACQHQDDDSLASRLGAAATDKKEFLRFGNAVHELLLGNDAKVARFTGTRRGKAWDAFQADAAERDCSVIVNAREHALAAAIAAAVRGNATAMRLLFDGTAVEQRLDWTWIGRSIRSTPDARGKTWIADLKTAQTAQPQMFARAALRLHYHAQAALYALATETLDLGAIGDTYVVAVEKTRPHPVTVLRFTEGALDLGGRLCRLWMEQLLTCEATSTWPEYSAGIVDLDVADASFGLEIDGKRIEF